jgi:hypothetical protein
LRRGAAAAICTLAMLATPLARLVGFAGIAGLVSFPWNDAQAEETVVELIPDDRAGWGPSAIFSFARPGFNRERRLRIETVPPGAKLDLFYVRASFQKRYEQVDGTPVSVILPTRAQAGKRDSVTIRASLDGYRIETVHVPVRGDQEQVLIELQPLPNTLAAVSHTYFAGRAGLSFLTRVPVQARVQDSATGFTVVLAQTARDAKAESVLDAIRNPFVQSVESTQLGEDLLVQVKLAEGVDPKQLNLRSRESQDAARGLSRFTIDLAPGGAASVERARGALGQIGAGDVSGCAAVFDDTLRRKLDRAQLSRALAPRGEFTDPYVRAALRRLGEVSGGAIRMEDGTSYRAGVPIELTAASSQGASAKGFLALLRAWARVLEPAAYREEALRSLVAPELDPSAFERALGAAEAAERSCRGA